MDSSTSSDRGISRKENKNSAQLGKAKGTIVFLTTHNLIE